MAECSHHGAALVQLTEHFAVEEFDIDGSMPDACVPTYKSLCTFLLEPLRVHYGEEIVITSGYRSPAVNAADHGVANSQHVATAIYCAADWKFKSMETDMRPVFDLIRSSAELQFDQLILEHDPYTATDVIHSSWSRAYNRREALEGDTANLTPYQSWPVSQGAIPEAT